MRISDWSSDVCSSDLLRPVSVKVTARTRKVNNAGRRIVEVADLLGREVIHQRLGLGRRLALERRVENAVECPKIAIGSMALHQQQPVQRQRGRIGFPGPGAVDTGKRESLLSPLGLVNAGRSDA